MQTCNTVMKKHEAKSEKTHFHCVYLYSSFNNCYFLCCFFLCLNLSYNQLAPLAMFNSQKLMSTVPNQSKYSATSQKELYPKRHTVNKKAQLNKRIKRINVLLFFGNRSKIKSHNGNE